jgi:hypothetical protein
MITPPKLPLAPEEYDRAVMDRMIRSIEQFFEALARPSSVTATTLRLTDLVGSSTFTSGVSASDTSLTLADASIFPTTGSGTIAAEKFSWSGKSVNTLTGLTRGIAGTTAVTHSSGRVVIASALSGTVYADPSTHALYVVP